MIPLLFLALAAGPPQAAPARQVAAILARQKRAEEAFTKRALACTNEIQELALLAFIPDPDVPGKQLLRIAKAHPKDAAAVEALVWVATRCRAQRAEARRILFRDHHKHPLFGGLCVALRRDILKPESQAILRKVLKENASKKTRATAAFALACLLKERLLFVRAVKKDDPSKPVDWDKRLGKETVAALRRDDADAMEKEAERLFERLMKEKDFGSPLIDYKNRKERLADLAERAVFHWRQLVPGKPAPEIVGKDIDGKPMKLSDFKGKVVLLDFWGHW